MILLVDNYDSFTFNLKRYLVRLGQEVLVHRNDSAGLDEALEACSAVVLSPGPRAPSQAGRCLEVVGQYSGRRPILGICLGHQVIYQAFGGAIARAQRPIHGRDMPIDFEQHALFANIPDESRFARYHSLVADAAAIPAALQVIAWSGAQRSPEERSHAERSHTASAREIMAVAHRTHPTFGVQFHPESILSTLGYQLLANFLTLAGLECVEQLPASDLMVAAQWPPTWHMDDSNHTVVLPMQPRRSVDAPPTNERLR